MPKVLIVSVNDLSTRLGRTILWRSDVERLFESEPIAALRTAQEFLPDLIIVDADLPKSDGLLRQLREDNSTRVRSLVALTHTTNHNEEENLRRAGANAVLSGTPQPLWDARLDELMNVPRRRETRLLVHCVVWCRFSPDDRPFEGTMLNLSVRGMLLETESPIEVGTKLDLSFRLPGSSGNTEAVGQVVRIAARDPNRARMGIEFVLLKGDARDRIHAFVDSEN